MKNLQLGLIVVAEAIVGFMFLWLAFGLWPVSWLAYIVLGTIAYFLAQRRIKLVFGHIETLLRSRL